MSEGENDTTNVSSEERGVLKGDDWVDVESESDFIPLQALPMAFMSVWLRGNGLEDVMVKHERFESFSRAITSDRLNGVSSRSSSLAL